MDVGRLNDKLRGVYVSVNDKLGGCGGEAPSPPSEPQKPPAHHAQKTTKKGNHYFPTPT
jgi:hypothetical protein